MLAELPAVPVVIAPARLLLPCEAARLLGVHPSTLRRWNDRGLLDAQLTAGGHRRFHPAELERLQDELHDSKDADR